MAEVSCWEDAAGAAVTGLEVGCWPKGTNPGTGEPSGVVETEQVR